MKTYEWLVSEAHDAFGTEVTAEIGFTRWHPSLGDYFAIIMLCHVDDADDIVRRLNRSTD